MADLDTRWVMWRRRDEIRYDPQDHARVLAPTRIAWLGVTLAAFAVTGFWASFSGSRCSSG